MIRVLMIVLPLLLVLGRMVTAAPMDGGNTPPAQVKSLRVGSADDRLRLVVDVDNEVDYDTMVLANPGRIVVNLHNARLGAEVVRDRVLESTFASRIRVGQFNQNTVRIVVETEAGKGRFDVFSLEGGTVPYRVVIDIGRLNTAKGQAQSPANPSTETKPADGAASSGNESEKPTAKDGAAETEDRKTTTPDKTDGQNADRSSGGKEDKPSQDGQAQERKRNKTDKIEPPIELPDIDLDEIELSAKIKGKKIVIDPGHGGEDPGAIGPSGVTEKSITLRIAKVAQQLLENAGAKVIMTRTTDTEVSPKHRQATDVDELQARCDVANKANADVFVSIHMDSFASRKASGTTGYYYEKGSAASKKLAAFIQAAIIEQIKTESRGVKSCKFYVVRHTKMPATLIEVAFVSNPREEKLLNSEKGIQYAAVGLATGIAAFFDNS